MGGVLQDVSGPAETTGVVDKSQGRQRASNDFLCCVCHPLHSLPVSLHATGVPHCPSVSQQALDGGTVEGHQQLSV